MHVYTVCMYVYMYSIQNLRMYCMHACMYVCMYSIHTSMGMYVCTVCTFENRIYGYENVCMYVFVYVFEYLN